MSTQAGRNPSHVLTKEHREALREFFVSGLTPYGVQAHLDQYNREAPARGLVPFPSVSLSTIRHHYRRMKREIDQAIQDEVAREQLSGRKGLRDRDERLKWLEIGAEKLIPHLGSASAKGDFTAAESFIKYMEQIRKEVTPVGGADENPLDPRFLQGLSKDKVLELIAARKQGTGGTP